MALKPTITTMLRTCPVCNGRRFKEAYQFGMYFIRCEACGKHATFSKATEIVSAWCTEEAA